MSSPLLSCLGPLPRVCRVADTEWASMEGAGGEPPGTRASRALSRAERTRSCEQGSSLTCRRRLRPSKKDWLEACMPPPPCIVLCGAGSGAGDEREAAQDHRFLMQHGVEAFRDL